MEKKKYSKVIVIRRVEQPPETTPESKLEWICECLGIDRNDELARNIFKEIVVASEKRDGVSTRDMMEKANVTQGAIVYHMNSFMRSGIIIKQGRKYYLRSQTLTHTIEDIEQDMVRMLSRMRKIAKLLEDDFRMRL